MKIKNVIIISDWDTHYEFTTYVFKKYFEFETVLGENITRFYPSDHQPIDGKLVNKPPFPKARVEPILLNDLNKDTMVILRIRENHYLYNTTISSSNLSKEVIYDVKNNNLRYLFFNFGESAITIKSKIAEDEIGLLKYFAVNLEDNLIRETILGLLNLPKVPKDTVKRLRMERADNFIVYEGDVFAIKYNGGKTIRILNDAPVRDIVYLIHHKVTTSNVAELWGRLRNRQYNNDTAATNNFQKSRSRFLESIRIIENKANIPTAQRISWFVEKFININSGDCSISYEAPEEIRWELDLPDNLHD